MFVHEVERSYVAAYGSGGVSKHWKEYELAVVEGVTREDRVRAYRLGGDWSHASVSKCRRWRRPMPHAANLLFAPRLKNCPIQAWALSTGMVIYTGAYVCIRAVEVLGGHCPLPFLRIHCLPIPGEVTPTPSQCLLELRSDSWVSHYPMFKLERSGRRRVIPVLHLVSCVSTKLDRKAPAEELYCSIWFRMARAAVAGEPWVILSARHGVVRPRQPLAPYNESLIEMSPQERVAWAGRVLEQMPRADRYVLWAGKRYAEHLAGPLHAELPLRGLGIGQQLALLKQRAAQRAVSCPKPQPLSHASLMALCRSP